MSLLLLLLPSFAAADGLRLPATWRDGSTIAATAILSLDGDDWRVDGVGRAFSSNCTGGGPSPGNNGGCAVCEDGMNYSAPAVGPHGWYSVESLGMGDRWAPMLTQPSFQSALLHSLLVLWS